MMDRQKGQIIFECDGCGETLETDTPDFDEDQQVRRDNHWSALRQGDVWQHYCTGCSHP